MWIKYQQMDLETLKQESEGTSTHSIQKDIR